MRDTRLLLNRQALYLNTMALDITSLTKQYRGFILDNVSFGVPYGSVVGFIGENGAGKSTTLKTILGLVKKDAGTISVLGKREQDIDFTTRNKIGVVFACKQIFG